MDGAGGRIVRACTGLWPSLDQASSNFQELTEVVVCSHACVSGRTFDVTSGAELCMPGNSGVQYAFDSVDLLITFELLLLELLLQ